MSMLVNSPLLLADLRHGGVSEEQADIQRRLQAEGQDAGGEEGPGAHRRVDSHGVCGVWSARRDADLRLISGTAETAHWFSPG